MKKIAAALLVATALVSPQMAYARQVTINTQLKSYRGPGAYLAVYLTKPDGSYDSTIWVAGGRSKYYRHLRGWLRGFSASGGSIDGVTGASVGGGRSLKLNVNLADAMIDAGYQIHVDSAVEDYNEFSNDAVLTLNSGKSSDTVAGKGFVKSLTVSM